ncbi:MAG: hypothetical protein WD844_12780 [Thermoleophilaceae bacterium]
MGLALLPASASAQDGGQLPIDELFPPEARWLADCPPDEAFPEGHPPLYCLNVKAYDGDLKLGDTQATIDDPIEITVGISLDGTTPVIVMSDEEGEGGAGGPSEVRVPGGILGIPELDPLIEQDPLGVLSVTATPHLGKVDAAAEGGIGNSTHLERISLPLSIQLNNLLFGDRCSIGTPENPFVINLTTGTTEPPEGVEPLSGDEGVEQPQEDYYFGGDTDNFDPMSWRLGARSVDNTFAVPGANNCDTLRGLGLGGTPFASLVNLDSVINSQTGLPAPAGRNHMKISVDTAFADWDLARIARGDVPIEFFAWPVQFGDVEVGSQSEVETLTVRNVAEGPMSVPAEAGLDPDFADDDQFEVVEDRCAGQTIAPGEECGVDLRFTPSSAGQKRGRFLQDKTALAFRKKPFAVLGGFGVDP